MSNVAEILPSRPKLELVQPIKTTPILAPVAPITVAARTSPTREFIILACVLGLLQIADGVLTAIGVHYLGIEMEANPLLRTLMLSIGAIPTLIIVKGLAIGVIALLTSLSHSVSWLIIAMRGMVALYCCAAVIPWSAILIGYLS
jgi:hypothetical protein